MENSGAETDMADLDSNMVNLTINGASKDSEVPAWTRNSISNSTAARRRRRYGMRCRRLPLYDVSSHFVD